MENAVDKQGLVPESLNIPFLTSKKIFVLLAVTIFISYFFLLNSNLSPFVDNARYVTLAKSLASGQGYSRIHAPIVTPQTLYSPGYPLILAILIKTLPFNLIIFKLISVMATGASLFIVYLLIKRRFDSKTALTVTLLTGISPLVFRFSAIELTEAVFLVVSLSALLLIEKSVDDKNYRTILLAGVMAAACYYIKSAGLVFLPAAMTYFVYKKAYKKAIIFGLIFAILVTPWFLRGFVVKSPENGTYIKQLMWKDHRNPSLGKANALDLTNRVIRNSLEYSSLGLGSFSGTKSLVASPFWKSALAVLGIVFSILMLIGFTSRIRKGIWLVDIYALFYLGLYLLWPANDTRYLHPIIPFILLYYLIGTRTIGRHASVVATAFTLLAVVSLAVDVQMIKHNLSHGGLRPEQANFYKAIGWLKNNSPVNSQIMGIRPEAIFVLSDRKAASYQEKTYLKNIKKITSLTKSNFDYVIIDAFGYTKDHIKPLATKIKADSKNFKLTYSTAEPSVYVYKIVK